MVPIPLRLVMRCSFTNCVSAATATASAMGLTNSGLRSVPFTFTLASSHSRPHRGTRLIMRRRSHENHLTIA